MKSPERLSAAFFIVLSVILCLGSLTLRAGSLDAPGPMIFPLLLGLCLLVFSVALFVRSGSSPRSGVSHLFPKAEWRSIACTMAVFFAFTFVFEFLGLLVSTFLLMLLLMTVVGSRSLGKALVYSSIITVSTWLVFVAALGVRLPQGVLAF